MIEPYIGITGFVTSDEVLMALSYMSEFSHRKLMIGVLANEKTISLGLQKKWGNRYPNPNKIATIFQKHPLTLNLIHYNTDTPKTLLNQMLIVTRLGGPNFQGFQLNLTWPLPQTLQTYREIHPKIRIVLQIGESAFKEIGNSPKNLATKIEDEYAGLIDYILLDPSGGYGKLFNPILIMQYLEALEAKNLNIGLGVAGGLNPKTLTLIKPLLKSFPNLSIDAESKLRDKNDTLNLNLVKNYIRIALQLL